MIIGPTFKIECPEEERRGAKTLRLAKLAQGTQKIYSLTLFTHYFMVKKPKKNKDKSEEVDPVVEF